ncbi:E3 ubiquitin-protein ligase FANCL isoform X2 [Microcaecilia unicolor]|uniref:E3 ubiquitin-protein ligase FANCL isoform X2 n=1 Tax=Microcaecilia unicolor TaxID=1415580 RepID=A0A6P7XHY2_9AMPH|nr:E3 ubiquitin-protein ligase FANCL isoform X2 [Microcaecilia unicolor]
MMSEAEALHRQCPQLLPQNREKTIYDGFITIQDRDFRLRIILPPDAKLKNARLQCSVHLKNVLYGYHQIVKQRLQHSCDLSSFILELKTILENALKNRQELYAPPPPQYYSCLVKDIENLGWDKLVFVDSEFSTIQLKVNDSAGREHQITLQLKTNSSLINIQKQFMAALDSMKEFWDVMDEIDKETWVLEPENPTRNATTRRIAIGNNVSVNIEVDPRHPKMLPECYFLGADHVVTPLRSKLNNNIHLWDPENNLLENLKNVLEIDFPVRASTSKSDFSMDCGICYAYCLDTAIPDQVCDDPRCGQPFHQVCLYEWLRGLPSSRQSFNVIFGECPYCSKPIALKMSIKKS